jgi:uncharacterized integral membrane protein (TIGR00698 family)
MGFVPQPLSNYGFMMRDLDTDAEAAREVFRSTEAINELPTRPAKPFRPIWLRLGGDIRAIYPGFLASATIALASTWLSQHYGAPVMLFALLLGMAFHFLHEENACVAGIEFSSKAVLRLGVALLGAKITASQILGLGAMPIATVVVGVATTIVIGALVARLLRQSRSFGILSGGAVGICGASAALAIASVLPRNEDSERDTILTVVTVTALSTLAMIIYPLIATGMGLNHVQAGIFLGGTIHDVAQVVGAGYTISPQTGDIATYIKLLRVAMLLPVVFTIAFLFRRGHAAAHAGAKSPLPLFLLGFVALLGVNSLGVFSKSVIDLANEFSRWCLVTAIAALGIKTSFKSLIVVGWRPVAVMIIETAWICSLVMAAVLLFH